MLENPLADYNYCCRFIIAGTTEIGRVELHIDKDGAGADVILQIRDNTFSPSGVEGDILREVLIPAEFIPLTANYISIPINMSDLTAGYYWLVVKKAGDATNKNDLISETSQDPDYPCFRRTGDSGAWTAINALHFYVYSGAVGLPVHVIEGVNALTTIEYSAGLPSKISQYIPPSDGPAGGIRDILTLTYSSGLPVGGV